VCLCLGLSLGQFAHTLYTIAFQRSQRCDCPDGWACNPKYQKQGKGCVYIVPGRAAASSSVHVVAPKVAPLTNNSVGATCSVHGALPDATCTPGDIFPNATKAVICVSGYTLTVRNVPSSLWNKVFAEYGITQHNGSTYELTTLIPLELGGSNDIKNLFPEAATPSPGFHEKDRLENYLHKVVCNGSMTLQAAQNGISTNWLQFFHRFFP